MQHLGGTVHGEGGTVHGEGGTTPLLARRARMLGRAGALAVGLVALALSVTTWRSWPGWAVEEVSEGLGFLALLSATGVAWWLVTLLLGAAGEVGGAPLPDRPLRSRVAAWLLAAAAMGAAAPAHAAPTTTVVADVSPGLTGDASMLDDLGAGLDVVTPGKGGAVAGGRADVPEPGWTPTPSPASPPDRLPGGDVGLVSSRPADRPADLTTDSGVTVRAGDTLWDIAARHLGPEATDEDVAETWPHWYSANRELIGPDPDRILPGQVLTIPAGAAR